MDMGIEINEQAFLTERDLLCVALHMREFIEVHWKENDDVEPACEGCKLAHDGRCTESHLFVDPWPQFDSCLI